MAHRLRLVTSVLLSALLLTACSLKKPPPVAAPEPAPAPPPVPAVPATILYPDKDVRLTFDVLDRGAPRPTPITEQLLREPDRIVATYNGTPYVTWVTNANGIWRQDPKGPALLRYLPAQMRDGDAWKQVSGNSEVWFRLRQEAGPCGAVSQPEQCWVLAVVNRSEYTEFHFAGGLGPVRVSDENWATPADSFEKSITSQQPVTLAATDRKQLLDRAPVPTGAAAAVSATTAAEFEANLKAAQAQASATAVAAAVQADLDGDGKPDLITGVVGVWTGGAIAFASAAGGNLGNLAPPAGNQQRVTLVQVAGLAHPVVLYETGDPSQPHSIALLAAYDGQLNPLCCMAPKVAATTGNKASVNAEGLVRVDWEMGDVAGHRRVSFYRLVPDESKQPGMRLESAKFEPAGAALAYPQNQTDLLKAAFFARWYGLGDELAHYFATSADAAAFAADKRVNSPDYGPGEVQLGKVTPPPAKECKPKVEAGPAGNSSGFAAVATGYEWCGSAWGTVTFSKDPQGRPVIQKLSLDGNAFLGG